MYRETKKLIESHGNDNAGEHLHSIVLVGYLV